MRKRTSQGTDGHSQSLLLRPVVQIRANPSMSEDSTLDLVTLPPDMDGNHQIWGELTYQDSTYVQTSFLVYELYTP